MSKHVLQYAGAGVAAVAVAFVAFALGTSHDSSTASAQRAGFQGPGVQQQSGTNGQAPPSGQAPGNGQAPPGLGAPVSGAAARKAAAAATAKHPGQVERVMQLADGSYVVHVITSGGELHVAVSKAFAVTGVQEGGPGGPPPTGSGAVPSKPGTPGTAEPPAAGTTQT